MKASEFGHLDVVITLVRNSAKLNLCNDVSKPYVIAYRICTLMNTKYSSIPLR